jgi:hypothetical protein
MKVHYRVSEEYEMLFEPPFVVAEVTGVVIIIGGLLAHAFWG